MDYVMLVMEAEEAFGIEIPDQDAEPLTTVGQMFEYVCARLGVARSQRPCRSQQVFYGLRRHMVETVGVGRRAIMPMTEWDTLLPRRNRQAHWNTLRGTLGVPLPNLEISRRQQLCILFAALGPLGAGICLFALSVGRGGGELLADTAAVLCLMSSFTGVTAYSIASANVSELPAGFVTVGQTVTRAVAQETELLSAATSENPWTRDLVWARLQTVIVDTLEVEPDEVTPGAHFIDDLGCD